MASKKWSSEYKAKKLRLRNKQYYIEKCRRKRELQNHSDDMVNPTLLKKEQVKTHTETCVSTASFEKSRIDKPSDDMTKTTISKNEQINKIRNDAKNREKHRIMKAKYMAKYRSENREYRERNRVNNRLRMRKKRLAEQFLKCEILHIGLNDINNGENCVLIEDAEESVANVTENSANSKEAYEPDDGSNDSISENLIKSPIVGTEKLKNVNVSNEILFIDVESIVVDAVLPDEQEAGVKRICPLDEDSDENSPKKLRLSDEVQRQTPENVFDSNEPIRIDLYPKPQTSERFKPVSLDFLKRFRKPLEQMNRFDLEEFVLQKVVEAIAFKSTFAQMHCQLYSQDALLQDFRQKVHDLNEQIEHLETTQERTVQDLKSRNQHLRALVKTLRKNTHSPRNASEAQTASTQTEPSPSKDSSQDFDQKKRSQIDTTKTTTNESNSDQPRNPPSIKKITTYETATTPTNESIGSLPSSLTDNRTQQPKLSAQNSQQQQPLEKTGKKHTIPIRVLQWLTKQRLKKQRTRSIQEQLSRQELQELPTSRSGSESVPESPLAESTEGSSLTQNPEPMQCLEGSASIQEQLSRQELQELPTSRSAESVPESSFAQSTEGSSLIQNPEPMPCLEGSASGHVSPTIVKNIVAPIAELPDEPNQEAGTVDNFSTDSVDDPKQQSTPVQTAVVPKPRITNEPTIPQPRLVNINLMTRAPLRDRATIDNSLPTEALPLQWTNVTNGSSRGLGNGQKGFDDSDANTEIFQLQQQIITYRHPAPLPRTTSTDVFDPAWGLPPPRPSILIDIIATGLLLSWTMNDLSVGHATVVSYQIYIYQETVAVPAVGMWRHMADVEAISLPMIVALTEFQKGQRYYFAVRAVDEHKRPGQFSRPRTRQLPAKLRLAFMVHYGRACMEEKNIAQKHKQSQAAGRPLAAEQKNKTKRKVPFDGQLEMEHSCVRCG
ncbi:activating transcription factor 7-interacting protein 1-like [Uranotaenia lowii]|uniref:activating transcription factor 7-interacting protein 1-like n=1 Tax=Uranotaenia lowii TaxID=190385 RepID=UPI00247888E9|nr:activating transcription factor 7-interacting protein 1-like [Uranotaenia lowii]